MTATAALANPPTSAAAPVRVAVLDDHPAIRVGIEAMLAGESDLSTVGLAARESELWPLLRSTRPDALILDIDHPGQDGFWVALRLDLTVPRLRLVLYTAQPGGEVALAAALAGAEAVLSKAAGQPALLDALRRLDNSQLQPISAPQRARAASLLDPADHAILAMRLASTSQAEIATTLGLPIALLQSRLMGMLHLLRGGGPAS